RGVLPQAQVLLGEAGERAALQEDHIAAAPRLAHLARPRRAARTGGRAHRQRDDGERPGEAPETGEDGHGRVLLGWIVRGGTLSGWKVFGVEGLPGAEGRGSGRERGGQFAPERDELVEVDGDALQADQP